MGPRTLQALQEELDLLSSQLDASEADPAYFTLYGTQLANLRFRIQMLQAMLDERELPNQPHVLH